MDQFKDGYLQRTKLNGSFQIPEKNSTTEATNWVCASVQDDHAWITEFSLVLAVN